MGDIPVKVYYGRGVTSMKSTHESVPLKHSVVMLYRQQLYVKYRMGAVNMEEAIGVGMYSPSRSPIGWTISGTVLLVVDPRSALSGGGGGRLNTTSLWSVCSDQVCSIVW